MSNTTRTNTGLEDIPNHRRARPATFAPTSIGKLALILMAWGMMLLQASVATAQTAAATKKPNDGQELAKQLSNPVASLISVPFQSNFDFRMGSGSGWRYTLNFQPVIPVAINKEWNLISRTVVPIIHQAKVTAANASESGLGDVVQSIFISPNKTKPFIWGVGPAVSIPTATNGAFASKQLGLGPTGVILKQQGLVTYGALVNHIWRVAGSTTRARVNTTYLQPFIAYTTKDAWTYSANTESIYNWTAKTWSVPVNLTVAKLVKLGKQRVSIGGGLRCWATSPNGGAKGCGLRFVFQPVFPKK